MFSKNGLSNDEKFFPAVIILTSPFDGSWVYPLEIKNVKKAKPKSSGRRILCSFLYLVFSTPHSSGLSPCLKLGTFLRISKILAFKLNA